MVGLQSGNSPLKFGKGGGGSKKSCRQTTLFVWYHQESNRGHKDFQSFALPTELWHHPVLIYLYINDLRIACSPLVSVFSLRFKHWFKQIARLINK